MGAHKIGHEILLFAELFVQRGIFAAEFFIDRVARLSHIAQDLIRNVLRRDLELAGDVVLHQFAQEGRILVGQQIVKADAAADEDLLHAGDGAQLTQQVYIIRMVRPQIAARRRKQALPVLAGPVCQLFFAGGLAEIGRRAADVMDVALEVGMLRHARRLGQQRVMAARLDDAALMERQRAERAAAEAAAVRDEAELHLGDGGHAARLAVGRVIGVLIRQSVDVVHLLRGKRRLRRVLHHELAAVRLDEAPGGKRIGVAVLNGEALGVAAAVGAQLVIGRQRDGVHHAGAVARAVGRAVHEGDIVDVQPAVHGVRDLDDSALAHAVEQEVGLRIEQDGALQAVRPVVIVCQAAQAGLDTADEDRDLRKAAADEVAVDDRRIVRPLARRAAGRIGIRAAAVAADGIVIDHGVHIAARHKEAEARLAEFQHGRRIAPVRLRQHGHTVARTLEHAADDGMSERRVIDIGVAEDIDKVRPLPAEGAHLARVDRKKARHYFAPVEPKPPSPRAVSVSVSVSKNCAVR